MAREWVTLRMLKRDGALREGELVTEHHTSAAKMVAAGLAAYHGTFEATDTMQRSAPVEKAAEEAPVTPEPEAISTTPEPSPVPTPVVEPTPAQASAPAPVAPPAKPSFFSRRKRG